MSSWTGAGTGGRCRGVSTGGHSGLESAAAGGLDPALDGVSGLRTMKEMRRI